MSSALIILILVYPKISQRCLIQYQPHNEKTCFVPLVTDRQDQLVHKPSLVNHIEASLVCHHMKCRFSYKMATIKRKVFLPDLQFKIRFSRRLLVVRIF